MFESLYSDQSTPASREVGVFATDRVTDRVTDSVPNGGAKTLGERSMTDATFVAIGILNREFPAIAGAVPPPQLINVNGGKAYRFVERTIEQAIVLKVARAISSLHAATILLAAGHGQELAMMQRVIDETGHEVQFLCGPLLGKPREPRHDEFLEYFFKEEFEEGKTPLESTQNRGKVSHEKIMAYNAREYGDDPSTAQSVFKTIYKTYSGYVHGAAGQVLDLFGGNPPVFHLLGYPPSDRLQGHADDFANYPYRVLMSANLAALSLKLQEPAFRLYEALQTYDGGRWHS